MDFVLKMMDFVLKMMKFLQHLMDSALKMMDFLLNVMDCVSASRAGIPDPLRPAAACQVREMMMIL